MLALRGVLKAAWKLESIWVIIGRLLDLQMFGNIVLSIAHCDEIQSISAA